MLRIDPITVVLLFYIIPISLNGWSTWESCTNKNINAHEVLEEGILHKKLRHILKTGAQY